MKRYEYLIIGQGIAGTCLAIFLKRAGKEVLIIDESAPSGSSRVAAGYMHPITGRRIVKSWMAEQLFPFAADFYDSIGAACGIRFFHPMDSLEMIPDARTLNEWMNRSQEPGISSFIEDRPATGYQDYLTPHLRMMRVTGGGWLDIVKFLDHHQQEWLRQGSYRPVSLDTTTVDHLQTMKDQYGIHADKIVYCEGQRARFNPSWKWLPFDPVKGELMTVAIPLLPEQEIIVNGLFLIPIGNHRFRAGSTYSWNPLDDVPTEEGSRQLRDKLDRTLTVPYEIIDHRAGVRPAVKGRRPFLGRHPEKEAVYIFNGLGSKGSTLGPWFARHFTDHLVNGNPLMPEVDIRRFSDSTDQ